MKHLCDEVLARFPEVAAYVSDGDEELPYLMVGYVADWLLDIDAPRLDASVIDRVVQFDHWCMEAERGETAADDIPTIYVVAFLEKLFEHDKLLPIIGHLCTRSELLDAREYLTQWVGADRYQSALRMVKQ